VPAIQVFGLREVGVATEPYLAAAGAETGGQSAAHLGGGTLVSGAAGRAVDRAEYRADVGRGQHQGVVAPGAVMGAVPTCLARAGGLHQEAPHVEDSLVKEGGGLLGPSAQAEVVDEVLQLANSRFAEAAAEVAGGARVGDLAGAQGVEEA